MVDIAVEACGRPDAFNNVFRSIRHQGQVIIFGMQHEVGVPLELDWESMYEKLPRMTVTSSARADARASTVASVVSLVSQGRLDLSHMLTHRMPFEKVGDAFEMYSNKLDNSIKILLDV